MTFEDNGKHWLIQLFEGTVNEGKDLLNRSNEEKAADHALNGRYLFFKHLINKKNVDVNHIIRPENHSLLIVAVNWASVYGPEGNKGHKKIISLLLEKGADTTFQTPEGMSVWDFVDNDPELLEILPSDPRPKKADRPNRKTP